MPVLDRVEVVEGVQPESGDFRLSESVEISEGVVREDGAVVLNLIRPCVGRGKGRHLYTAEMLEANAQKFTGWKMYLNHLSEAARRALGGLPRDVRDVGGIVSESFWNPDVPAEGRFGKGAVQGVVKPVPLVQELLRVDPRLVEASINATATDVKKGRVGKEEVWIVEGIEDKGSVDWVTEAGAGGRVAEIMEAMIEDGSAVTGVLESLDDDTILDWIEEHRPELAEAIKAKKGPSGDADDGESDDDADAEDIEEEAQKLLKSGKVKTHEAAVALAKQSLKKKKAVTEGDGLPVITAEDLTEALTSDEGKAALSEALSGPLAEAIKGLNLGDAVVDVVEARLDQDREVIRAEATARASRQNDLRDMRDSAHRRIEESKLPDVLKKRAKAEFDLVEGTPTSKLNLVNDEDEHGEVVKSARQKLDEAVDTEIREAFALAAELNPTRVRGQGPNKRIVEGEGGGKGGEEGKEGKEETGTIGPLTHRLLESSGIREPEKVYERSL